jgi:CDP-glycerol:poly(glycerophosphate) glycerophosphotransferase
MAQLTVFLSIPQGASAANVLRSGIARRLLDDAPDARMILFSPLVKDPAFVAEFAHPRIVFENLPPHTPSGLEGRLLAFVQASYIDSAICESVKIRCAEALVKGSIRWIRAKRLLAGAFAPSITNKATRYALSDRLVRHPWAEAQFDRYRPTLVVTDSPGLIFAEVPLLRTAARRGVRSVAVDPSWDNFTNKLIPVRRVNRLLVWNDVMKQEAIDFHGYDAAEIRASGVPQFDHYFRADAVSARDVFFRRIGGDPARKLVTLTTSPSQLYSHFDRVIRILAEANASKRWPLPAQILVRVHPRDNIDRYRACEALPDVIVEKPFKSTVEAGDGMAVDILAEHRRHLADTMAYSDVVIGVASTITIEAAIFDTPIVNVSFDGETPSPFELSARRYYQFTHFAKVMRHRPGPIVETPEALVAHVGRYLADRSLDADGRRRVVLEQCQFLDGRATERIAAALVAELHDVCAPAARRRAVAAAVTY